MTKAVVLLASLLMAACASLPPEDDLLAARASAALAQRGLETDILQLVDNVLRHEPGPPPHTPSVVRALLAQPLAAADAQALFRGAVPPQLLLFDRREPTSASFDEMLAEYIAELAAAQALLREAIGGAGVDLASVLPGLEAGLDSESLVALARTDQALLQRANARFTRATAQFVSRLRAAPLPQQGRRFDSPIGVVVIGTRAGERHAADAALIIDPGGDDHYERAPVSGGRICVVIDLAGNDRYDGSDIVVQGLAAIVDFSGDDRYAAAGPGLAAALAGASLLVDFSGNDSYEAGLFGQGAAAFGLGALIDHEGDDSYRVRAAGQGLGLAGGLGLLWDRSGNDRYSAGGMDDAYGRGGGVSFAQGAAFGYRTMLAGGIGILRDDAGDDAYEAQMFAQGTGYYYGLGLAWDRGGNDRWRAVRYAQGNGVHEAVGVLRDEAGDDRYELGYGVGQGMGLDLAVGLLYDAGGDDRYQATVHAQGNATANGIGVLFDRGGKDEWHMSADRRAWGEAESSRGLPSLGLVLYEPKNAAFLREGKPVSQPRGGAAIEEVAQAGERRCPAAPQAMPEPGLAFAAALRSLEFLFRGGEAEPGAHAYVQSRLRDDLERALGELPGDDFTIGWILGHTLPCVLKQAADAQAAAMWSAMERVLSAVPPTPFALPIAIALRERPAPPAQLESILQAMQNYPSCMVRAAALVLEGTAAAAQSALRSSCWLLQASALKLGANVTPDASLPSFLRRP